MSSFFAFTKVSFQSLLRSRIFLVVLFFSLFWLLFSFIISSLGLGEQVRISLDFGLSGLQWLSIFVTLSFGCSIIASEIESRTLYGIITTQITRHQFIFAKWVAVVSIMLLLQIYFAIILSAFSFLLFHTFTVSILIAVLGIFLETVILLSLSMFFSLCMRTYMSFALSFSVVLLGHWLADLKYFSQNSSSLVLNLFSQVAQIAVPNLETVNFKYFVLNQQNLVPFNLFFGLFYTIVWSLFLILATSFVFRRKDLV